MATVNEGVSAWVQWQRHARLMASTGRKGVALDQSHGSGWTAEITLARRLPSIIGRTSRGVTDTHLASRRECRMGGTGRHPHITIIHSSIKATFGLQPSWIPRASKNTVDSS